MAMILDNHVHLVSGTMGNEYLSPHYRWWNAYRWAYGPPQRPPYERDPLALYPRVEDRVNDPDGSATVAAMDKAGVDAAVLIHADHLGFGSLQAKGMEEMHQDYVDIANRYPGRFYPFAGPDVRRPGSLELVTRGIQDGRFKGFKVMPEQGYFVSDRILYPFYDVCLEAGVPVAICANFEPPMSRGRFNEPLHITDVVADFPDLNVIIFHAGFPFEHWFEVCLGIGHYALNTYLEFDAWGDPNRCPEEQIIRRLARARDMLGAHRITFGTDGQFSHSPWGERRTQGYVRHLNLWRELPERAKRYGITFSREEVELMMGLNLARLLKIVEMPEYEKKRKYGWKILMPGPRPTP
ncbi:MAG: amidohydrolase family protein [Chloroflexi bacterium]|nr:amidohydrolase family protein [Chloroflexota bacterium]